MKNKPLPPAKVEAYADTNGVPPQFLPDHTNQSQRHAERVGSNSMRTKKPRPIVNEDSFFTDLRATVAAKQRSSRDAGGAAVFLVDLVGTRDPMDPDGIELSKLQRIQWELCRTIIQKQTLPEFMDFMCFLLSGKVPRLTKTN